MAISNSHPIPHKPLHRHVLESLEHIVDRFGMYMAIAVMLMMVVALITIG